MKMNTTSIGNNTTGVITLSVTQQDTLASLVAEKVLAELTRIGKDEKKEDNTMLPLKEAAAFIGRKESTMYKYTSEKKIPFYKPTGKNLFFLRTDLESFNQRCRSSSIEELSDKASTFVVNHK